MFGRKSKKNNNIYILNQLGNIANALLLISTFLLISFVFLMAYGADFILYDNITNGNFLAFFSIDLSIWYSIVGLIIILVELFGIFFYFRKYSNLNRMIMILIQILVSVLTGYILYLWLKNDIVSTSWLNNYYENGVLDPSIYNPIADRLSLITFVIGSISFVISILSIILLFATKITNGVVIKNVKKDSKLATTKTISYYSKIVVILTVILSGTLFIKMLIGLINSNFDSAMSDGKEFYSYEFAIIILTSLLIICSILLFFKQTKLFKIFNIILVFILAIAMFYYPLGYQKYIPSSSISTFDSIINSLEIFVFTFGFFALLIMVIFIKFNFVIIEGEKTLIQLELDNKAKQEAKKDQIKTKKEAKRMKLEAEKQKEEIEIKNQSLDEINLNESLKEISAISSTTVSTNVSNSNVINSNNKNLYDNQIEIFKNIKIKLKTELEEVILLKKEVLKQLTDLKDQIETAKKEISIAKENVITQLNNQESFNSNNIIKDIQEISKLENSQEHKTSFEDLLKLI